jgi:hypothetical protein
MPSEQQETTLSVRNCQAPKRALAMLPGTQPRVPIDIFQRGMGL